MLTGEVSAFDPAGGWGTLSSDEHGELGFHATAIASGERTVDVGARVMFRRVPGRVGRWEADRITPIEPGSFRATPGR